MNKLNLTPSPGYYFLKTFGVIKISGKDGLNFLQGQLTIDVSKLTKNNAKLCAHCNVKGRMISLFYIFLSDENYYLIMPKSLIHIAISALKKYAIFFKVTLSDESEYFDVLGFVGDHADPTFIKIPSSFTRYFILQEKNSNESMLSEAEWQTINLSEMIPTIYAETSEKYLPHECRLDELQALDFDKGCYTGQEIIARMHYRGKTKTKTYLAEVDKNAPLIFNQDVLSKNSISGTIVDFVANIQNQYVLVLAKEVDVKQQHIFIDHEKNHLTFIF